MKEMHDMPPGNVIKPATQPQPEVLDWRMLADKRLTRLVELEHDHALMRERLLLLQLDYREVLVASEDQLHRISELDSARVKLEGRLADLAREHASAQMAFESMRASFVGSRSWRLTRPLRAINAWSGADRRSVGGFVRAMLRVPLLRRAARLVVRLVPGLHERLRSRLYPENGHIEP